jgi:quercetin dioxygenase-like cupin family protein
MPSCFKCMEDMDGKSSGYLTLSRSSIKSEKQNIIYRIHPSDKEKGDRMNVFPLNEMKERELLPGGKVKFVHSDNMTLASWTFEAGIDLPEHTHPHEQILNVMEGTIEFTVEGETQTIDAVSAIIIPPNVTHSGKTLTDCKLIDVFYPKREDFAALDAE